MAQNKHVLYDIVEFVVDSLSGGYDIEEIDELVENFFPEYYDFYLANKQFIMEEADTRIDDDGGFQNGQEFPGDHEVPDEDHEDWVDPAGGTHRWDDDDPASMYESVSEKIQYSNYPTKTKRFDITVYDDYEKIALGWVDQKNLDLFKRKYPTAVINISSPADFGYSEADLVNESLNECCGGIIKRPKPIRRPSSTNLPPKVRLKDSDYLIPSLYENRI